MKVLNFIGGLKRLGTVISRRKQDTNPPPRMPSPDKRSKSSKNPLKRGHSSRNMQQIPSPNASTSELPLSMPQQESSQIPNASNQQRLGLALSEQQSTRGELNGESVRPNTSEVSMTNGAHVDHGVMPLQELHSKPSTSKVEEVRDIYAFKDCSILIDSRGSVILRDSAFLHRL